MCCVRTVECREVRIKSSMGMGWLLPVLLLFHFSFSHSLCYPHDNLALLHFKASLTINIAYNDNYVFYCHQVNPSIETWENGTDCCSWSGVTCHPISGHVIALDLPCAGIQGEITANSTLFSLSHMQSLNLAFNNFSNSQIPSTIGDLVSLTHLNLSSSNFQGEIPPQISHLYKLQSLDLFEIVLKWEEGTWKRMLQNATHLRVLVLNYNDLSSTSMTSLNLSSSLITLSLRRTGLTGKLTDDSLCLPNLQHLYLSYNSDLHVQLPSLSCSSASLNVLEISSCELYGPIPPSFSNLTHLTFLDLSENDINGSIPSYCLPNLHHLYLSFNSDLQGQLPDLSCSSASLNVLEISMCDLQGTIPPSFSNLTHLTLLDLSENYLNSSIPPSLLTLPRLNSLVLYNNYLSGQIPNVFHQSNKFEELDLSGNNIQGEVPSTISNLQHLIHLDISYNRLEGPLPNKITGFSNLTTLKLTDNLLMLGERGSRMEKLIHFALCLFKP